MHMCDSNACLFIILVPSLGLIDTVAVVSTVTAVSHMCVNGTVMVYLRCHMLLEETLIMK